MQSNKSELQHKKMTQTPINRLLVSLSLPSVVNMLLSSIYNMADTYFVGTLGESQQGATGILFSLQAIIQAFAFMFGHGSGSNISRLLGAKNVEKAKSIVEE